MHRKQEEKGCKTLLYSKSRIEGVEAEGGSYAHSDKNECYRESITHQPTN